MAALATIETRGPLTPSELAEFEGIKRPTATRVLQRLLEAGLIERTADPSDGRSAVVSVTREGTALLKKLFAGVLLVVAAQMFWKGGEGLWPSLWK